MTRQRRPAGELLRVVVRDNCLHIGLSTEGGRGAWVSPTRSALETLQAKPGMAWRTLRVRQVSAGPLLSEARQQVEGQVIACLRRCWRSGLLQPDGTAPAGEQVVLVLPDADAQVGVSVPLVATAIGDTPVSRYGVRAGRPTRTLAVLLQRMAGLC